MRLTQYTDYSLRVLLFLGLKNERATVSEIAKAYGISRNHLVKVVHHLSQKGLVASFKGANGGISLAVSPEQLRLGELVQMFEPDMHLVECFAAHTNTCPIIKVCLLESLLYKAQTRFLDALNEYTLADLLKPSASRTERMRRLGLSKQAD